MGIHILTEVRRKCLLDEGKRIFLLVKDQLLDRPNAVGDVGDSKSLRTREVVDRSTLLQALAALDAVIHHGGLEGQGASLGVCHVDGVVGVDQKLDEVIHLCAIRILEFLVGGHLLHGLGLGTDLHALVHAAREYHLKGTAHIEERRIVPAVGLCRLLRLDASDDVVVTGIRKRQSSALQSGNDHFIIIISGESDSRPSQLCRTNEKFVGGSVPNAHREGGLRKEHVLGGGHRHEGQIVGGVHAVFILSARNEVLEQAVARKALGRCRIATLVEVIELDPYAIHQLLRILATHPTRIQILFIIRIHILVKSSGRDRMSAGLDLQQHLYKPKGLARLAEAFRTVLGNATARRRNVKQLALSRKRNLGLCHGLSQRRIASCISDGCLTAHDHRTKEVTLLGVMTVARRQSGQRILGFLDDAAVANRQDLLVVGGQVTDSVVKVIAGRENVVRHGKLGLIGHIGGRQLACGSSLPILIHLGEGRLGGIRDVEGIRRAMLYRIKFRLQPLKGILGKYLTSAGGLGGRSDDQLILTNDNGQILQDVLERLGTACDDRLTLGLLVGFGQKHRAVRLNLGQLRVEGIHKLRDSRRPWQRLRIKFHELIPFSLDFRFWISGRYPKPFISLFVWFQHEFVLILLAFVWFHPHNHGFSPVLKSHLQTNTLFCIHDTTLLRVCQAFFFIFFRLFGFLHSLVS